MNLDTQNQKFWSLLSEEVANLLETNITSGLSELEAKNRLKQFGKNIIQSSKRTPRLKIFINQLKSPLILILIVAGAITLIISHYRDSIFIFIAVIVNSILGFYQENKAEHALSELKTYLKQRTRVIRDSREREIGTEEIVLGDIIRLSQGDRVPADARIIFANDFQIDESILTGESLPANKNTDKSIESANISDQKSMIFAGTLVTQGTCLAIVCRTNLNTELGKIAALITAAENETTPLQAAITKLSIYLSIILGILTLIMFAAGIFIGYSSLDMFLIAVAIAISAIPEGLPISMTVILAIGVERMAKRKGVIRKLIAAEALGNTTIILTDKTGTLTMAKMALSKIIPYEGSEEELLRLALTNTDVLIENPQDHPDSWHMSGKIMETALVRSAVLRGINLDEIIIKKNILQTTPFNAVRKFSVSLIKSSNKYFLIFLGAPDILVRHSSLNNREREILLEQIDSLAYSGERVLGVAIKEITYFQNFSLSKNLSLSDLSFRGLITFHDPVRQGIKKTISRVACAGIKTIILTGDHRGTAMAVAREIGIKFDDQSILDASELNLLSEEELRIRLPKISIISRVTPFDKLRIAKLFQEAGEIVAMTGDGVNDAPSIKQADIGIAMGSGTEVAQSVADLVLLDDNFETIVAAIEEGRQILGNIKKVLVYLLSNVMNGLVIIGGALLMGVPLPLNALQILWVNFFSDSFPAMAFAFEKDHNNILYKPKKGDMKLFDPLMKFLILVIGISTSILLFITYYILLKLGYNEDIVRTFTFAAFGTYSLLFSLSVRNLKKNILSYPIFSNYYLTGSIIIGVSLMAAAIYMPSLQRLFNTVPLSFPWIIGVFLVGLINILLIECSKYFFRYIKK